VCRVAGGTVSVTAAGHGSSSSVPLARVAARATSLVSELFGVISGEPLTSS